MSILKKIIFSSVLFSILILPLISGATSAVLAKHPVTSPVTPPTYTPRPKPTNRPVTPPVVSPTPKATHMPVTPPNVPNRTPKPGRV